ncbi:MAG: toll/interleukin-1 receptor domain-containing protein [Actinomycetota bacterium]|nr:toll/interleukin-1 receptor domain-containing protein [Actinomycetota bacterium]
MRPKDEHMTTPGAKVVDNKMPMPTPTDQPAIQCFLSYAHDDEAALTFINEFKTALNHFAYSDRGRRVEVFVDHDSIGWGEEWHQKIRDSIRTALVFIPLITMQYLSRPMCREELMLFVEGAQELGVTELFLPVVVLGHRSISEDSNDAVAQRIAKRQFKDLRDAVLQGTKSATWRTVMLDIANSLVDAVESAEESLTAKGGAAERELAVAVGPGEIEDDTLGLEELSNAATEASDEVLGLMEEMTGLIEQVMGVIVPAADQLNAAANRQGATAVVLKVANDVKPISTQIEGVGSRLEVRTAEMDSVLRSAWILARDHGGPELAESVRNSIMSGAAGLLQLEDTEKSISEFLQSLRPTEVMSVPLRKAIRPMRMGVTSFQSSISTMRSWPSITDA